MMGGEEGSCYLGQSGVEEEAGGQGMREWNRSLEQTSSEETMTGTKTALLLQWVGLELGTLLLPPASLGRLLLPPRGAHLRQQEVEESSP